MNFKTKDDLVNITRYLYRSQIERIRKMAFINRKSQSLILREAVDFYLENAPK